MSRKLMRALLFSAIALTPTNTALANNEDTRISQTAQEACAEYGERYNICAELLEAIIERESSGNKNAIGGDCEGLMQINPDCHRDRMERLGVTDLFDERGNILVGADYLAELFEKHYEVATVLMIYHGERNALQKAEDGEISDYAAGILERSAELEMLHGK